MYGHQMFISSVAIRYVDVEWVMIGASRVTLNLDEKNSKIDPCGYSIKGLVSHRRHERKN